MQRFITAIAILLVLLAVVNFVSCWIEDEKLGGDAMNGSMEAGHYYVASEGHKKEVSEAVWVKNLWHGRSVFITHPLGLLALGYLLFKYKFPALLSKRKREDLDTEIDAIERSGHEAMRFKCGARFGKFHISQPQITTFVYPGGMVMKPIFMAGIGIPVHEIERIEHHKRFFLSTIEIHHRSESVQTPFYLYCSNFDEILEKLRKWHESS